ncbi:uncharacterized protein LOC109818437 [Cajanus cajan]|uniref:uncharacterized protein LOC109818437 n=1 Tax=Cajanus cajan TaxID=3821 RepID=UPI00098D7B90|nr:uncharacterized protein LOC109818437 [Cajanus cajan]
MALSFLLMPLFLFTIIVSPNTFSSYASPVSYTDHCGSMVPIPNSTLNESKFKVFPHGQRQDGYYLGGGTVYPWGGGQKHVTLQIKNVFETDVAGILKVGARLEMRSATWYYRVHDGNFSDTNMWNYKKLPSFITFLLEGFLSESSGKLCMVGTETDDGMRQPLEVVLRLYNVVNSRNTISTLVTGSLESVSSEHEVSYFESLSLFIFPKMDYEYSLDTKEIRKDYADEGEVEAGLPVNPVRFCSKLFSMINGNYDLQYQRDCKSAKNCSPVEVDANQLPYIVSLKVLVCSNVKQRLKLLIGFGNIYFGSIGSFNPNSTLVGEGWWDEEKNQLCIVGCHFLGIGESMASVHVGDCSTRMSMRFPKIWSMNDASSIVGQIWSNKAVGDSGYFKRMILRSHQDKRDRIAGIKYEYSQLDKARKMCPRQEPLKNKGIRYPDVYSSDMRFGMGVEYYDKIVAWGSSITFGINDQIQKLYIDENFVPKSSHTQPFISANSSYVGLYNVSYQISFSLEPDAKLGEKSLLNAATNATETDINVSAEGIYDAESGSLCMVGCRNLGSSNLIPSTDSVDCEIIVKFQFQQPMEKNCGGYIKIKGSIESMRKDSDPLHFIPLNLSTVADYPIDPKHIIAKVDVEIIMILVSTTLECVFVGLQLYHMKKNSDMLPLMSFIMLLILTLGNMTSLVLNFHSLLAQNHAKINILLENQWLGLNEIGVRLIAMATFLLQLRLLKLTWSTRKGDRNKNGLWIAEKKVLYVIFPLYAAGFLIALLVFRNNALHDHFVHSSGLSKYLSWMKLKFYSDLVLDGFLLPQILLNIFWNSKGNALCFSFFFGISMVRLLPRACDDLFVALLLVLGYVIAEPQQQVAYYSRASDKITPLVVLMFAIIIYLQQRFGGRSILFLRNKGKEYEKVSVVTQV